MSKLWLVLAPLLLFPRLSTGSPVVLDNHGKQETLVTSQSVQKDGWPWGWVPVVNLLVKVPGSESDDVLVLQHYQGATKWGPPQKCARGHYDAATQIAEFECRMDNSLAINKAGEFRVDVSYKNVATGKTQDGIGSLAYTVDKYDCDNRHQNKRFTPSPCFVVNHDFRIGEAWLEETVPTRGDYNPEPDPTANNSVYLRVWIKTESRTDPKINLRCYFNAKVISSDGLNRGQTEISYQEFPKANAEPKTVMWRKWWFAIPNVSSRPPKEAKTKSDQFYLSDNPGNYRCVATSNGEQVAEVVFVVGADGNIQHAPCQDETRPSAVTTASRIHLVKVTFRPGFNARFNANAFKTKPLYGKRWIQGCPP